MKGPSDRTEPVQPSGGPCRCEEDGRRRRLEQEEAYRLLMQANRLAIAGQLLKTILHEIQQPLAAIRLHASIGWTLLEAPDERTAGRLREVLDSIDGGAGFAIEIIDRVQRLSGNKPLERRPFDLAEAIEDVIRLIELDAASRGVVLEVEVPSLPLVVADRVMIQQLMLDLLMNGIEAAETSRSDRVVTLGVRRSDGHLELSVGDTGPGFPAELAGRLFDTFFTTKPHGMGLGLAIARSIVEAHRGSIWLDGRAAPGATFRVRLPLTPMDEEEDRGS